MRRAWRLLLQTTFLCVVLWLILRKVDLNAVVDILGRTNISYFTVAIMLSAISMSVSGLRSRYYMWANGLMMSKWQATILYFVGSFFNLALPGGIGGDGYKVLHLSKRFTASKRKTFHIVLCERVNGFFILTLMGFALFYITDFTHLPYLTACNTLLFIAVAPCYYFGICYVLKDKVEVVLHASLYSVVVQALQVAAAIALAVALNIPSDMWWTFVFLFIAASIIAIFPISVGSIGVRELTFLYGLQLLGTPHLSALGISFASLSFLLYAAVALIGAPLYYLVKY